MSIELDYQLREKIPYDSTAFPISYFHDELAALPNWSGPMHWHHDFEIVTALCGVLDVQIGRKHILLEAGDSIFVNQNMLHGIQQVDGHAPDPMPNIVFLGAAIAPETSSIYKKYIWPIACCDTLPFIVFKHNERWHQKINASLRDIYCQMTEKSQCYEMAVQRELSNIFESIFLHFKDLPKFETTHIQMNARIRIQKMLSYIYEHYAETVTLEDIAKSANISRSEAGRCFNIYMGCSPVEALIQYRLQMAHRMLTDVTLSLREISEACGFNSVNYFSRRFKKMYGYTPGLSRALGK